MTEPVTDYPFLDCENIPPGVDLVAEVRDLNEAGVEIPWMWSLSKEPVDVFDRESVELYFGVNNEVGMLTWTRGNGWFVPIEGMNTEWQAYYLAGYHESYAPPYCEVPVEMVYEAVAEFLTTWKPPICLEWKEDASLLPLLK